MGRQTPVIDEAEERIVRIIEGLLADMRWDVLDLAKRIYPQLGYASQKAVLQWFQRKETRRIHAPGVAMIAKEIGVDPAYILGVNGDLEAAIRPGGLYDLATRPPPHNKTAKRRRSA